MSLLRREDESSLEDEREALRRQRAEGAAELARLKQVLAERVEFVRLRERELEQLLQKAGGAEAASRFRLPEARRDDRATAEERAALTARTAELVRRESAVQERENRLTERERAVAASSAPAVTDAELATREAALLEREAELDRRRAELDAQDPAEREERIEARLLELREAELQFVKTQAELAARSDRLAEHEQELAARERALGGANGRAAELASAVDIEALEARLRRLEQSTTKRGTSFSAGVRAMQQRGTRPRKEPDGPLH